MTFSQPCRRRGERRATRSSAHFGAVLALAERQAAPARFRHQLRHPAAREAGGIGVLVVDPDVHVEPLGFVERDLPEPEPVVATGRASSSPGRGWTKTCLTFWPARSRSVSRICCSVSRSFQTQSGAGAVFARRVLEQRLDAATSLPSGRARPRPAPRRQRGAWPITQERVCEVHS